MPSLESKPLLMVLCCSQLMMMVYFLSSEVPDPTKVDLIEKFSAGLSLVALIPLDIS